MSDHSPWYPIVQELNVATENLFSKLYKICEEIGFKENARQSYYEQAHHHLTSLMTAMLEEAETKKEDLFKVINSLLEEVHTLSAELKKDLEPNDFDDVPLVEVKAALQNQVQALKQSKEQRLNYLEELRTEEHEICKALGVQPLSRNEGIPSYEELENFKLYLEKQEETKARLEKTFTEMRSSIMRIMEELSITPALEFEVLICTNPENFVYTAENMVKLRELRDNLKENLDSAKEKASFKREELIALWNHLEVPDQLCQAFLDKYPGHSLYDIHAMNEEIKLCKQKRSENMAKYVEKVREQLRELWDMCRMSEEQRKQFRAFNVQTYTENLLTLHDLEVERLRAYYNKNRKIYELLNDRENMWEKGKELDQRANDPERLHNRGGQLLMEEKERKLIQKKLPKLEEQIKTLIQEYETENGEPFTINGLPCDEFFMRSLEDYAEMKETLKKARQAKAKDKSIRKTPVMSTSRRTPGTATSMLRPGYTSVKKRSEKSPLANSAKRRMVQSEKSRPTVCTSRVRRSDRLRHEPRKLLRALNASNRSTKKIESDETTLGSVSQYEQFQEHLKQREELRSSLLPEQVLKNARGRPKMRTPVKTPVKPLRKNVSSANTPNSVPKTSHLREPSRSPRLMSTPRLAAAPNKLPIFF